MGLVGFVDNSVEVEASDGVDDDVVGSRVKLCIVKAEERAVGGVGLDGKVLLTVLRVELRDEVFEEVGVNHDTQIIGDKGIGDGEVDKTRGGESLENGVSGELGEGDLDTVFVISENGGASRANGGVLSFTIERANDGNSDVVVHEGDGLGELGIEGVVVTLAEEGEREGEDHITKKIVDLLEHEAVEEGFSSKVDDEVDEPLEVVEEEGDKEGNESTSEVKVGLAQAQLELVSMELRNSVLLVDLEVGGERHVLKCQVD